MTSISSAGGSGSIPSWLQQKLFAEIDTTGSGSITKTSLEKAVTSAGGNATSADALYAQLDPNNTGSVSQAQFDQNLPSPPFSSEMGSQMVGYQANGWPGAAGTSAQGQLAQSLFSQIDTTGSGAITKASLEQAVTSAGGSAAAADALYAKLDPDNTGSVSEQQFTQALSGAGGHHHHHGGGGKGGAVSALASLLSASNSSGATSSTSTQDQLVQSLFSQIDTTGSGSITQASLEQAVTASGGSTSSADALYAKLDPNNTGSVSEQQFAQVLTQPTNGAVGRGSDGDGDDVSGGSTVAALVPPPTSASGTSAQDALFALLNQGTSSASSVSGAGTSDQSGSWDNSGAAALEQLLAAAGSTGASAPASGTTAEDALTALLQTGPSYGTASSWGAGGPSLLDFTSAISQYESNAA